MTGTKRIPDDTQHGRAIPGPSLALPETAMCQRPSICAIWFPVCEGSANRMLIWNKDILYTDRAMARMTGRPRWGLDRMYVQTGLTLEPVKALIGNVSHVRLKVW